MIMKQCANGHFFDQTKDQTCPYCKNLASSAGIQEERRGSKTIGIMQSEPTPTAPDPVHTAAPVDISVAVPTPIAADTTAIVKDSVAAVISPQLQKKGADAGHTVAIIAQKLGVDPVVGWVVCVEGKDKGRDFRIHADNNFIGRDEQMDIALISDETISRRNHAVISFDSKTSTFYFSPDEGRSITRHNGKPLFSTVELAPKDEIEIGLTKLIFIPLCGKDFNWE